MLLRNFADEVGCSIQLSEFVCKFGPFDILLKSFQDLKYFVPDFLNKTVCSMTAQNTFELYPRRNLITASYTR